MAISVDVNSDGPLKQPLFLVLSAIVFVFSFSIYKLSYNKGIRELNTSGLQRMNLYLSQVSESFGQKQQFIINLVAHNQSVISYLQHPSPTRRQRASEFLNTLVGNGREEFVLVAKETDLLISPANNITIEKDLQASVDTLRHEALRGQNRSAFGLTGDTDNPIYLFGSPVLDPASTTPIGITAVIINLSTIQQRLANEWTMEDEVVLVSDSYGIIILSSREEWLYKSITDLPYAVKKQLRKKRGVRLDTDKSLGIAKIESDEGVVTVSNLRINNKADPSVYLANSLFLPQYRIRVHHLANTRNIRMHSFVYAFGGATFLVVLLLYWLYDSAKSRASRLALEQKNILAESEAHKKNIINATDSGLICFYPGGNIESMNAACQRLLGSDEHQKAEHVSELFIDNFMVKQLSEKSSPVPLMHKREVIARRANGEQFPAQISISPMQSSSTRLFLMTLIDISEQKKNEAERRNNQKMIAMGMVSATVAHELNQPLTAIKTEAAIAQKLIWKGETDQAINGLASIIKFADTIAKTTNQLRTFSRIGNQSKNQITSVYEVIQNVHILFKNRLQQDKIEWQESLCHDDVKATISKHELQQVLTNIIQNACDAMQDSEHKTLCISVEAIANTIKIDIRDSGYGIAENQLSNIFQPFFSTKIDKGGMGLGLSICEDIVARNGGDINVCSSASGTLFTLLFRQG